LTLVILEGLSATGKSTLAPLVAMQLGAAWVRSIPPSFEVARREIDGHDDVNVRHLFYATALAVQTLAIRRRLDAGETIVLESYIDRANAFHRAMGSTIVIDESVFINPRITVLIECQEEERLRRLAARPPQRVNPWQARSETVAEDIRKHYYNMNHKIRVPTDSSDAVATAAKIAAAVREML
jgi:thymidylate kinase